MGELDRIFGTVISNDETFDRIDDDDYDDYDDDEEEKEETEKLSNKMMVERQKDDMCTSP